MFGVIVFIIVIFIMFKFLNNMNNEFDMTPEQRKEKYKKVCPKCGSENCHAFVETIENAGKTKTRYSANLNPLHPLTLINKNEKVVKKPSSVSISKFQCDDCGKIFY